MSTGQRADRKVPPSRSLLVPIQSLQRMAPAIPYPSKLQRDPACLTL